MVSALTVERVRGDVSVLAKAGIETGEFLHEFDAAIQRVVPHVALCSSTTDPATLMVTATYKFGDIADRHEHDRQWGTLEYLHCEPSSMPRFAHRDEASLSMHIETGGDLSQSQRMRELIVPIYGYGDELRVRAVSQGRFWGGMAIYRGHGEAPFTADDVAFVGSLTEIIGLGFRAGVLTRLGRRGMADSSGPGVIIVGRNNEIERMTPNAEAFLRLMGTEPFQVSADGMMAGLIAAARREPDAGGTLPRTRLRLPNGHWLVVHATRLATSTGESGEIAITIEEARPPEIVPIVVAAFDLTDRERDVAQLVLQDVDTKAIATSLHMSAYTVQDHLKSIFDKAGVRSRRELLARIFFDQYVPRMGSDLAPSGWFLP
jgi:DNA-binding CsgD family transcriptional regulator